MESDDSAIRQEAPTVDLSPNGVRVVAEPALAPGQVLSLIQADDPTHPLHSTVVWAGDVGSDGPGQAGLEFLEPQPANMEN